MVFVDDPRRAQIEPMHEFMTIWASYWRDSHTVSSQVSPTWMIMDALERFSGRVGDIRENFGALPEERKPIKITRSDNAIIAEKVRKLIHDQDAWRGRHRLRHALVTFYLKTRPKDPIGRIARKLECKPWQVNRLMCDALYYMSTVWKD